MRRLAVRYGRHHSQIGELWRPDRVDGPLPLVVLLHGGFWKGVYTKHLMRSLASAVTRAGWAAWNVEYRRVGRLGGGGGWPATFGDVAAAVDHLARIPGLDHDRIVTCGHSAGGHLALWVAGRHRLPAGAPGAGPLVAVRGAVSLAGVVDLASAAGLGLGGGAVEALLGGPPDAVPDRYALGSPAALRPLGVPQVLVHGLDDTVVPPSMSERYQIEGAAAGDDVVYVPLPDIDHMDLIHPRSAAWPATLEQLRRVIA